MPEHVHRRSLRNCVAVLAGIGVLSNLHSATGLTLDTALQRTMEKNPAIQQAKALVEEAAGTRLIIRSDNFADIRTGGAGGAQGGKRAGENELQPFVFALGSLRQPLFNAAAPARSRRGNTELLIAKQRLNLAVMEHLHAARVAFSAALYNRSLQSVREEQHSRLDANLRSQLSRYESGVSDRGMVASARLQAQELGPRIEFARRNYADAQLKLAQVTGEELSPDSELPLPEGELQFVAKDVDVATESAAVLERRADLQLARSLVDAATDEHRIIEAAYLPALTGVIDGRYIPVSDIRQESQGGPSRSDDVISSEMRFAGVFTWRVIDNGRVAGAALEKRKIRELNDLLRQKLEANVPRELTRIKNQLQAIAARYKAFTHAAAVAEENIAATERNLAEGIASQLEFRAASLSLLEARSGLVEATFANNIARADWDRATGRYFEFSQDSAENVH